MNEQVERRKGTSLNAEDTVRFDALKETVKENKVVLDEVRTKQIEVMQKLASLGGNGEVGAVKTGLADVKQEQKELRNQVQGLDRKVAFYGGGIAALSAISILLSILKFVFGK